MNNHNDKFEAAVKAFSQGTIPQGPSDDLVRQTLERIEQTNTNPLLERIFKMKPLTKIAAAAIVIVGISAVFLFPTGGKSIALAAVCDNVLKAQAIMYEISATITDSKAQGEMEGTVVFSNQHGMKMESTVHTKDPNLTIHQQIYVIPGKKTMVVMPELKMYQPMENPIENFEDVNKLCNLREAFKELMTQTTQQCTDLGHSEIDGIRVQGFQTIAPIHIGDETGESITTFWVDVDTQLPVKYEMDTIVGERESHIVMDQFEWDIPVDASDFEYVIPDDYKEMGKTETATTIDPGSIKLLEMNDQAAIKGLEAYKEFFGRYPEKIDLVPLMTSLTNVGNPKTELGEKFLEKIKRKMETIGLDQDKLNESVMQDFIVPLQSLGTFYMTLVQGKKDPAYYGDRVTPDNVNAVLMRWKNDDGTYTVIFGDLSSGQMTYEDMIQLEPQVETAEP